MLSFVLRRVVGGFLVFVAVVTFTFFLLRVLPGGPFDREKALPEEIKRNIEAKYHLDKPLHQQFLIYISGVLRGDFGPSYKYLDRTANDIIKDTLPVSLKVGGISFLLSTFFGVLLGIWAGVRGSKLFDVAFSFVISFPSFVLAIFLVLVFSLGFKIFPPALFEGPEHWVLPVLTLSLGPTFYIARIVKTSVQEVLEDDFVRFARARGVSGFRLWMHVFRASLAGFFSVVGLVFAFLITGSFIVETVFAIPGMGKYFVFSVIDRDYPVVMALTIVFTAVLITSNILSEILYAVFDPRARRG